MNEINENLGKLAMVCLLIENGANITIEATDNNNSETALDIAKKFRKLIGSNTKML